MKLFPHIAIAAFTVATLTVTSAPAEARNRHAPRFAIGPKKAPSFHWSGRRAQRDKNRRVTTSAKLIAIHSEQKLSKAKRAIDASLVRLSPQQRGVIDTNVHYSINIILFYLYWIR